MPHVVAIGSHPSEFLTHLEAASYTYTTDKTYSESNLNADEAPVAVAVYGSDVGLESTKAILSLLEMNNAIGTVIDLPQVKLEDNVPLIVFKMCGISRFHIVPGFAIEQQSTESRQSTFLELSVKLIKKCITHASDPIVLHQLVNDTLIPPTGTMWWSITRLSLVHHAPETLLRNFWWTVDVYTYATGHTPIPNKDFAKNGGMVYIVMKHNGSYHDDSVPINFFNGSTSIGSTAGGLLRNDSQYPQSWSSVQDQMYHYVINFNKTVTLFKDNGQTAYNHTLHYGHEYFLENIKQTSASPDEQTFQFELQPCDPDRPVPGVPLDGLSVWRSDVGDAQIEYTYVFRESAGGAGKFGFFSLDLTFGGA